MKKAISKINNYIKFIKNKGIAILGPDFTNIELKDELNDLAYTYFQRANS